MKYILDFSRPLGSLKAHPVLNLIFCQTKYEAIVGKILSDQWFICKFVVTGK